MSDDLLLHDSDHELAAAAAARLVTALVDAIAARGEAHLVLTGGSDGNRLMGALAGTPARLGVDWAKVHFWWGDERFVALADQDRNELQARGALLDELPVDPAKVHAMPSLDGPDGDDVDAAAARHAADLAAAGGPGFPQAPLFDVTLLGVGPDGHCASLFPGHPGRLVDDATVIGVRESPKPPPTRISFTRPVLRHSREVWFIASGESKADAVAAAHSPVPAGKEPLPIALVKGQERTIWFLDKAAASKLP